MTYQSILTQNDFRLKQRAILERCLEVNQCLQMPHKKLVNECLNMTLSTFEALSAGYITLSISVLERFVENVMLFSNDANVIKLKKLTNLNYLILGPKSECYDHVLKEPLLQKWQYTVLEKEGYLKHQRNSFG